MKDLLRAHLEDHVRMSADPDSSGGDVPQHRVEHRAVLPVGSRIDPDEHAVELQELLAHLERQIVGVDRRLGANAERGQRLEDVAEFVVVGRRVASRLTIAAPQQRSLAGFPADNARASCEVSLVDIVHPYHTIYSICNTRIFFPCNPQI